MLYVSKHPLVMHKLSKLRDLNTRTYEFRKNMEELAVLLGYELTADFPLKEVRIKTPIAVSTSYMISKDIVIVAVLRAGLALMEGLSKIIPDAKLAHIGLYRDEETLKPVKYYLRFPDDLKDSIVVIVDPMLATGGSAVEAVNIVKSREAKNIYFMSAISSRMGIDVLRKHHPDIKIFTAAVDEKINDKGYIVPGLGDAGDRMFGTD